MEKQSKGNSGHYWNTVAAISAMIAAVAAVVAIMQMTKLMEWQLAAERPYITVKPRYVLASIGNGHELSVVMENIGKRPASSLTLISVRFSGQPAIRPIALHSETIVNAIGPGEQPTFRESIGPLDPNHPPEFVVLDLKYGDHITGDNYSERHYFLWKGAKSGEALQAMGHVVPHQVPDLDAGFAKALEAYKRNSAIGGALAK